jgi:type IV pilus assembly protein PilE
VSTRNRHGWQGGFSLVELMTVVVVISILAAIAIPAYRQQVIRSTRTDAKVALTSMAGLLERCLSRFNAYDDPGCITGLPLTTADNTYTITGVLAPGTFALTATPINGQAQDNQCGALTLNQLGVQGVTGSLPVNQCW